MRFCRLSLRREGVLGNGRLVVSLCRQCITFSYRYNDRLGPDNFSTLQIKGHVLHRAHAHLKVPS